MENLDIKEFKQDNILIQTKYSDDINLIFIGSIDMINPSETLEPFFSNMHNKLLENKIKIIYCDVTKLKFINSGGIKSFVTWIIKLSAIKNKENKYKIIFNINKNSSWQAFSFKILKDIDPEFIDFNASLDSL